MDGASSLESSPKVSPFLRGVLLGIFFTERFMIKNCYATRAKLGSS
jgi:hypothetical protein